jgi:putative proteasome-type protease
MTYCLGIKTKTGFIGIADTRITSGNSTAQAKKVYTINEENHSFFIMTSGLRSVRDKAMTYFKESLEAKKEPYDKLYKIVNAFANEIKQVAREDRKSLKESGLSFNLFSIIGGQLEKDDEHKIYLLYPEGNWVEVVDGSPFVIIGNNGYGKPILDRTIKYNSSLKFALKAGFLSFDATRISANDVDFPIDVLYYEKDSFNILEKRYRKEDMFKLSKQWNKELISNIKDLPNDWLDKLKI